MGSIKNFPGEPARQDRRYEGPDHFRFAAVEVPIFVTPEQRPLRLSAGVTVHPVTGRSDVTHDWRQDDEFHWIKTVGARTPGDPRDGELHGLLGDLPDHFDLEPWEEWEDQEDDVRYFKSDSPPIVDDEGRTVWIYEYRPSD